MSPNAGFSRAGSQGFAARRRLTVDFSSLTSIGERLRSVENCIVLDDNGPVNGALRFRDEFVRHKVLDLLGDLALLGRPLVGEITASRAGHALHSRFVAALLSRKDLWVEESGEDYTQADDRPLAWA